MEVDGGSTNVVALVEGEERSFPANRILLAAGRVGNTEGLGLEAAGITPDARGFVSVDEELRTEQPHIFAIGDVKGGWMFKHVATYDGPIAALNVVKDAGRRTDYRVVPRAVFTDPTLAAGRLTESQAREQGYAVKVGAVPADGARAKAMGERRGRLKAVVERDSGEISGFQLLAYHGDDLLHEAVATMHGHGTIDRIGRSIHVHPTLSEMVESAARAAR